MCARMNLTSIWSVELLKLVWLEICVNIFVIDKVVSIDVSIDVILLLLYKNKKYCTAIWSVKLLKLVWLEISSNIFVIDQCIVVAISKSHYHYNKSSYFLLFVRVIAGKFTPVHPIWLWTVGHNINLHPINTCTTPVERGQWYRPSLKLGSELTSAGFGWVFVPVNPGGQNALFEI